MSSRNPRKRKKKGKEEREGERGEKEEGEGAGRRWLRWPPSHAGGIPVTAVSPEKLRSEVNFFIFFNIKYKMCNLD